MRLIDAKLTSYSFWAGWSNLNASIGDIDVSTLELTNAGRSNFRAEVRKLAIEIPVAIVLLSIVVWGVVWLNSNAWKHAAGRRAVNNWLDAQREGRDGLEYWSTKEYVRPSNLYAVRSWEIVDSWGVGGACVTVRVESSNKAGQPIVKLWEVWLEKDSGRERIFSLDEK